MPLLHRNHDDDKDKDSPRERHATDRSPADENRDRSEQNRTAEIDRQRAIMRSPSDSLAFLDRHQEEVKKDEEARTQALRDSPRGKRIEAAQKRTQKDAEGNEKEQLNEAEAIKRARETPPPAVKEDGTTELPAGAALPPAVPEPRNPAAGAWERPLAEPPAEEDAETASTRSNRREHAKA